jgi:hypothetical protein
VNPPTDATAQHFAQRPGFTYGAHERIERELGSFVVRSADSNVALRCDSREVRLFGGISNVSDEHFKGDVGSNRANPLSCKFGFPAANRRRREEVSVDVVRFVNVWLNERHARHTRVAGDEIENRHPAASGTDLE